MSLPLRYNPPRVVPQLTDHNLVQCIAREQARHAFMDDWPGMSLRALHMLGWVNSQGYPVRREGLAFWLRKLVEQGRITGCEQTGWRAL